ncbi:MAG: type II toxin-antitoxin system prevent-host-death family antitoxin [Steroidobacteraceae bacterium]
MSAINIHAAKTHLSQLVERAARGETVIIAKSGKPLVKMIPVNAPVPPAKPKRTGFMAGQLIVPDAEIFNRLAGDDIAALFGAGA